MISQIQAAVSAILSTTSASPAPVEKGSAPIVGKTNAASDDKTSFSTLASQLNESAARAAKRDAGMTHEELGQYGRSRINAFLVEAPEANSATRAMEVPDTQDPELLDRARAATAFIARTDAGDDDAKNPFQNLSREQLNLIAYDDSGVFTLNERRAAWQGVQKMDEAWRKVAISHGTMEQTRSGKASAFNHDVLSYFRSLPAIERAVNYPKNTEAMLEARAKNDLALPGIFERSSAARKFTLYDVLAGVVDTQKNSVGLNPLGRTRHYSPRTSPTPVSWNEHYAQKEARAAKALKATQTVAPTPPTVAASVVKPETVSTPKPTT